jgi:hypothetical protein
MQMAVQGALYVSAVSLLGLTLGTWQRWPRFFTYLLEPAFIQSGGVSHGTAMHPPAAPFPPCKASTCCAARHAPVEASLAYVYIHPLYVYIHPLAACCIARLGGYQPHDSKAWLATAIPQRLEPASSYLHLLLRISTWDCNESMHAH